MVPLQTGVVFTGTMSMDLSLYFFSTSGTFINILFLLIKKKKKKPQNIWIKNNILMVMCRRKSTRGSNLHNFKNKKALISFKNLEDQN